MNEHLDAAYQHVMRRPSVPPWARFLVKCVAMLVREFTRDQVLVRAATLAYWSLVAIVPALVLAAAVTEPLGHEAGRPIREILYSALLAGALQNVGTTLDSWLAEVDLARLGIVGFVAVAFTASRIYFSVEDAYNSLWNVRMRRSLVMRLVIFYAGLTLGPLLIALGFAVTTRVQNEIGMHWLRLAFPVLLTATAFVGAIRTLPDTDVRWGPALAGGLASAVLFEAAKVGFNAYVDIVVSGSAAATIYGSLGLAPVFLIWLYVLWVIVLFGVELAFVVQRRDQLLAAEDRHLEGDRWQRRHADALFALQCLLVVARRYVAGHGPTPESVVTQTLESEPAFVRNALETLEEAAILAESPAGYLPALPLDRLTPREVVRRCRERTVPALAENAEGTELVARILEAPGALMDSPVETLVAQAS